jgi:hypothetical protein
MTPVQAIRAKCLDCMCGSAYEVKLCPCSDCSLFAFRLGRNPNRAGKGHFAARNAHITGDISAEAVSGGSYIPSGETAEIGDSMGV